MLTSAPMLPTTISDPDEYLQHYERLTEMAHTEFDLSMEDAGAIAHDILVASLRHSPMRLLSLS
jgi:hypothetical protein